MRRSQNSSNSNGDKNIRAKVAIVVTPTITEKLTLKTHQKRNLPLDKRCRKWQTKVV